MRLFSLFLLFLLMSCPIKASNVTIDSLKQELINIHGVEKIHVLIEISKLYSDVDVELAIKYANEALEISILQHNDILKAEAQKHLGKYAFDQAKYDKSFKLFSKSLQTLKDEELTTRYSEVYQNFGLIYSRKGLLDSADIYNDLALFWALKTEDTLRTVNSLRAQGNILYKRGQYDDALILYNEAIEMAAIHKESSRELSLLYNNLGVFYSERNDFKESLKYYNKSLSLNKELGKIKDEARLYNNIGTIFWYQSKPDSALLFYLKSLEIRDSIGDINGKAYVLNNLGMYYGSIEDFPRSLNYFKESLTTYKHTVNRRGVTLALFNIASVYQLMGDIDLARKYFSECLNVAKSQGFTNYELDSYEALKDVYAAEQDWEKAYTFLGKYKNIKDSIQQSKTIESMKKMETEFQEGDRQASLKILDDQIQAAKYERSRTLTLIIGMIIGLLLILLSAYLMFKHMKVQKQMDDIHLKTTYLRHQLNPEFIKSCLSGIKEILGKTRIKESGMFLAGLAKLIRIFIETSTSNTIVLEKEITTIETFLNLHQMRYEYELNYDSNIADNIETEMLSIPPFLLFSFYIHIIDYYLANGKVDVLSNINIENNYLIIKTSFLYYKNKYKEESDTLLLGIVEKTKARIKLLNNSFNEEISFTYSNTLGDKNEANTITLLLKLPLKTSFTNQRNRIA